MAGRLTLAAVAFLLTLAALELVIRQVDIAPDGFLRTRAAQRWYERHWQPINRFGYRDEDYDYDRIRSTRRLLVLEVTRCCISSSRALDQFCSSCPGCRPSRSQISYARLAISS